MVGDLVSDPEQLGALVGSSLALAAVPEAAPLLLPR